MVLPRGWDEALTMKAEKLVDGHKVSAGGIGSGILSHSIGTIASNVYFLK